MPRVVHFEIPVDNPDRAARFYSTVFGWKIEKWSGPMDYWLVTTGSNDQPGINGALARRGGPLMAVTNTMDVASVDDFVAQVLKNGGKVVSPKMPIPGVGYLAYCQDTEGNLFGLIQSDMSAK